jgi:hypothetical protein
MKYSIIFSAMISLLFCSFTVAVAQDNDCNKTKVAVSVDIVDDIDNYKWLTNDFGDRPKNEWNGFVTKMLVQILTEYEPEITFFPLSESNGDHHYHFEANMSLNIIEEDDGNEYTGYWIIGSLIGNANCIPNRNWILDVYDAKDRELQQSMKNMVSQFWPMDRNIVLYEQDHPSPPRDPELNIDIKEEYISPLDKESRKTKVNAKVYDCRGNLVCDKKGHGQPVYYQDNIDRLDLKIGHCEGGYHIGDYMVIITYKDCNNEGEYKLEKGVEAEKKNIRFKTCSLGGPPEGYVVEEEELIIRGLEIEVKPDLKEIEKEEQTRIVITFNETDPDGSKYPVEGKELDVTISGLVNGKIKPENGYTTNSDGKVVLDYKSGSNDERIMVTASFQPEDYPDKAEGRGSVIIRPPVFDARINVNGKYDKTINTSREDPENEEVQKHYLKESVQASATIFLTLTESQDMPIFNQTWQYYKPSSVNLSGFSYNSEENRYSAGPKYETTVDYHRNAENPELEGLEQVSQIPWILVIDNESGKAVKFAPAGFNVAYEINETENMNSVIYTEHGPERDSKTSKKTRERSFALGPVAEKVPDPTIKSSDTWIQDYLKDQGIEIPAGVPIPNVSNEETIKKIHPDILVKFGDGKTSIGGDGSRRKRKDLEDGYEEQNFHYNWSMTVTKRK